MLPLPFKGTSAGPPGQHWRWAEHRKLFVDAIASRDGEAGGISDGNATFTQHEKIFEPKKITRTRTDYLN